MNTIEPTYYHLHPDGSHSVANPMADLTKAAQDVLAERQRQIEREGYTPEHDDEHTADDLADAAAAYALIAHFACTGLAAADVWPWDLDSFKPRDQRQNYVRAAALLQAAIERLDRAATHGVMGTPADQPKGGA